MLKTMINIIKEAAEIMLTAENIRKKLKKRVIKTL